eukprot:Ihof_evm8s53 gene=Ihof_evmTU8s53
MTFGLGQLSTHNDFSPLVSPALDTVLFDDIINGSRIGLGKTATATNQNVSVCASHGNSSTNQSNNNNPNNSCNQTAASNDAVTQGNTSSTNQPESLLSFMGMTREREQRLLSHSQGSMTLTQSVMIQPQSMNREIGSHSFQGKRTLSGVHSRHENSLLLPCQSQGPFNVSNQSHPPINTHNTSSTPYLSHSAPMSNQNTPLISPLDAPINFLDFIQSEAFGSQQTSLTNHNIPTIQQHNQLNTPIQPKEVFGINEEPSGTGKQQYNPIKTNDKTTNGHSPVVSPIAPGSTITSRYTNSSFPRSYPGPSPMLNPSPLLTPLLTPSMPLGVGYSPRIMPDLIIPPPALPHGSNQTSGDGLSNIRLIMPGSSAGGLDTKSNYQTMLDGGGSAMGFSDDLVKTVEDRKSTHKQLEKKRRDHLKVGFMELMSLIPSLDHKNSDNSKLSQQYSKAHIIRRTINYVHHLKRERETLLEELERLRNELKKDK